MSTNQAQILVQLLKHLLVQISAFFVKVSQKLNVVVLAKRETRHLLSCVGVSWLAGLTLENGCKCRTVSFSRWKSFSPRDGNCFCAVNCSGGVAFGQGGSCKLHYIVVLFDFADTQLSCTFWHRNCSSAEWQIICGIAKRIVQLIEQLVTQSSWLWVGS